MVCCAVRLVSFDTLAPMLYINPVIKDNDTRLEERVRKRGEREREQGLCMAKVTCALLILLSKRRQWQTQVEEPPAAASLDDNIMLSCRVLFYHHPRVQYRTH